MSNQNMLEYDFIVMDSATLLDEVNNKYKKDVEKRIADLHEFIKSKNIPIVIFISTNAMTTFRSEGKFYTLTELLQVDCKEDSASGTKMEIRSDSPFTDLLKNNITSFEYHSCFTEHIGIRIANAKNKNAAISFYTPDFVFLPSLSEDNNQISEEEFLHQLFDICRMIRNKDTMPTLPVWSGKYRLPGEKTDQEKLMNTLRSIEKLEIEKIKQEQVLSNYLPLKQLWTAGGSTLEKAVLAVFRELGFTILDTTPGRDDLIMKWKKQVVIAEIKGLTKSAAEKNAAQLEKWVSSYISEHGGKPKGLLIANTFRETSLTLRTQESFPNQMIPYSLTRNHCLLTTLQLCCLLLHIRKNPKEKEAIMKKLLNTSGVFVDYREWNNYIDIGE